VHEGDPVARGDVIAVIETDKAELDLEALASGVLVEIVHGVGTEVPVGETIAYIETE
jgi:pyruvate/2-oxoglutarate dehydrogenase complex dihydrolipoamide acyltransferase (E2) component